MGTKVDPNEYVQLEMVAVNTKLLQSHESDYDSNESISSENQFPAGDEKLSDVQEWTLKLHDQDQKPVEQESDDLEVRTMNQQDPDLAGEVKAEFIRYSNLRPKSLQSLGLIQDVTDEEDQAANNYFKSLIDLDISNTELETPVMEPVRKTQMTQPKTEKMGTNKANDRKSGELNPVLEAIQGLAQQMNKMRDELKRVSKCQDDWEQLKIAPSMREVEIFQEARKTCPERNKHQSCKVTYKRWTDYWWARLYVIRAFTRRVAPY